MPQLDLINYFRISFFLSFFLLLIIVYFLYIIRHQQLRIIFFIKYYLKKILETQPVISFSLQIDLFYINYFLIWKQNYYKKINLLYFK